MGTLPLRKVLTMWHVPMRLVDYVFALVAGVVIGAILALLV